MRHWLPLADESSQDASSGDLGQHTNAKGPEHEPGAFIIGADDGIRTRDPHLGKVMLYQLSHVRVAPTG